MTSPATQRFLNLPDEKRERIERAATAEFASKGYENANTNDIAAAAGISVGALFAYFETKQDLFLHITGRGSDLIEQMVGEILASEAPVLDIIQSILELIAHSSRTERESVQFYQLMTGPGDREESAKVAFKLETFTSKAYVQLMKRGQEEGDLRTDIPAEMLAFHLDNIFITLQYSLASDYFEQRRTMYFENVEDSDEALLSRTMQLITAALQA